MNSMPAMKRLKGRMKTAVTIRVKIYFYSTFRDKHPKGLQNKIPKHKNKTLTKPKSQIIFFFFSCFCYSASMFGGDRRHQIPSLGQTRVRITMNISMDGSEEIFCCTVEWEMSACVWNKYLRLSWNYSLYHLLPQLNQHHYSGIQNWWYSLSSES